MKKTLLAFTTFAVLSVDAIAATKVVTSFSILADMTKRVGGELVEVKSIVGPDQDMHVHQPTPDDVKALAMADVFVVNGLGFEGWQKRLIEASGFRNAVVTATDGIKARKPAEEEEHTGHDDHEEHGEEDPHAWQNPELGLAYVDNIAKGLCVADQMNCSAFKANAETYKAEIKTLHEQIKADFAKFSAADRKVITSHDSFGYFAEAYGFTFMALQGVNAEGGVSAKDVAKLIKQVKASRAKALFVENVSDPRLIAQIGLETGVKPGGELYSDALSKVDGPAPTYIAMITYNAKQILEALTQ